MSKNKKKSLPSAVIDLTSSFTLADHCTLSDTIIDLANDESFDLSVKNKNPTKRSSNNSTPEKTSKVTSKKRKKSSNNARVCPICLDELGKNPLSSTKCGHVFCQLCLEQSLALEKRCPTCRQALKGKTAYHPLYLPSEN
ncbi:E3 ubiquitin-protein ligase RNF4-like [Melitaea cinxia]|uniref:E3 ubiquitin-protein ligase RNF4-like n=1 Tax=Melitaea cinxia TaxID=113334 RepID=UPI001E2741DC|nr:E3 ubiquitin-protein ligase RNF4-like [Melitaea cinxia]